MTNNTQRISELSFLPHAKPVNKVADENKGTSNYETKIYTRLVFAVKKLWKHLRKKTLIPGLFLISLLLLIPLRHNNPENTGFVTRSGSNLLLNGQKFRFAGTNMNWLGWNANLKHFTTHSEAQSIFSNMKSMNATVSRNFGLIAIGTSFSVEPSLNTYNDAAFEPIDYELSIAQQYGIRFIIPFVENSNVFWDHGKVTYTTWEGISDENQFYYNSTVIQDFKNHIAHILNHVNQYTRIAYKDDPAILCWETGNELDGAPYAWTESIAQYIKSIDSKHLILDGLPFNYGGSKTAQLLNEPSVDMYSDHYYPPFASTIQKDVNAVQANGKVFFIGEYDWHTGESAAGCSTSSTCGGDSLAKILSTIENNQAVSGDLNWEMELARVSDYFALHYPGDNSDMQTRVQQLTAHGATMNRLPRKISPCRHSLRP